MKLFRLALEDAGNELTYRAGAVIKRQYNRLSGLDEGIKHLDKEIESICKENAPCQQFMKLKGVGPMSASILFAMIGDASQFKNGRHFAAFLGLVPKEHSSGGKQNLLTISKRGDVCPKFTCAWRGLCSAARIEQNRCL